MGVAFSDSVPLQQRRIKTAIDAIAVHDPQYARYLRATFATGAVCRFTPVVSP